ncbi:MULTISPECIES: DUF2182 domain-containing protein [unclassified Beijerinckia]|uniref:DUF2182 domain-containing protein n=1 Tax=unclassified Beijerinckia TaxID=2638183 RepID=UPI0008953BAD|nr:MULTISPECIES: DUF2182 domain-containing protein [unclassified Beijerinckia]MDH7794916.1 putative metal-binding membrane protein [Beijerinckia sp. GAS462]SEB80316.1 Predicted metal-binding membrane protein [Beijerinckia sp. 28-YEA-48]
MAFVRRTEDWESSRSVVAARISTWVFFTVLALLFAANVGLIVVWCTSMSGMAAMPMPGDWTMSMMWMAVCGQTWHDAGFSFLGMWIAMMMAMMLPSLAPVLWRYHEAVRRAGGMRLCLRTLSMALGYFAVWGLPGLVIFAFGALFADVAMREPALARAVPLVAAVVVVMAGVFQFTAWKLRHLTCCRDMSGWGWICPAQATSAWRHGLRHGLSLGLHCLCSCAGLTAILLVTDIMDLRTMAAVTAAITIERLAPNGAHMARAIGAVVMGVGLLLIARAVALA